MNDTVTGYRLSLPTLPMKGCTHQWNLHPLLIKNIKNAGLSTPHKNQMGESDVRQLGLWFFVLILEE